MEDLKRLAVQIWHSSKSSKVFKPGSDMMKVNLGRIHLADRYKMSGERDRLKGRNLESGTPQTDTEIQILDAKMWPGGLEDGEERTDTLPKENW